MKARAELERLREKLIWEIACVLCREENNLHEDLVQLKQGTLCIRVDIST